MLQVVALLFVFVAVATTQRGLVLESGTIKACIEVYSSARTEDNPGECCPRLKFSLAAVSRSSRN